MTTNVVRVGGQTIPLHCTIREGVVDILRIRLQLLDADLQPLPSYDNWLAAITLRESSSNELAMRTVDIICTNDSGNNSIIIDIPFTSAVTQAFPVGVDTLQGVLRIYKGLITAPTESQYPIEFTFTVEENFE